MNTVRVDMTPGIARVQEAQREIMRIVQALATVSQQQVEASADEWPSLLTRKQVLLDALQAADLAEISTRMQALCTAPPASCPPATLDGLRDTLVEIRQALEAIAMQEAAVRASVQEALQTLGRACGHSGQAQQACTLYGQTTVPRPRFLDGRL